MQHYPKSIRNLIQNLAKLPGVGEKTAERLAIHILRRPQNEAEHLAQSILAVKQSVRLCASCYGLSDAEHCHICENPARDPAILCVVEQPADMIAIEKSSAFGGMYHILGGALAPMEGVGPEDLRIGELLERVTSKGIKEVILATGTSVEGESTAAFIAQQLSGSDVRVTRIASGVPVGGDLKYIDKMTLKCALDGRHVL
ncbi:MAG: recombination protein RecR [Desulfobacteraceae bacterium]|nr:MAG: recombination protein RecR [Desulfobacteraceae bacterium]